MANENLGAAERIIQALLTYSDHMVHNRPGVVTQDRESPTGVKWTFAQCQVEGIVNKDDPNKHKVVYALSKQGKKEIRTRLGVLQADEKTVMNGARSVGEYRKPGLFPEVCAYVYRRIAEVWQLDNELAARWASYQFHQEHRDLKVALAAFMLVQSRAGAAITGDDGKLAFYDEDYREVGEAMLLLRKDKLDLNPRLIHRVRELLWLPEIAKINHELGFGKSARRAEEGRWAKAVAKWLRYRERNPKMLEGLVKAGFRREVVDLACQTRYVPESADFYRILRFKQKQAADGRRKLALDQAIAAADTWEGLTEAQVCEKIVATRPKWNRLSVSLPKGMGLTRAIVAAAIEAGSISDQEMIILAPTIEELGLLEVQDVKERLDRALRNAENLRAANIALRMKSKAGAEKLEKAADQVLQKKVAEVMKGLFIYVIIDISSSMTTSIGVAKQYIPRFLQGFPPDKMVAVVFNTTGRVVDIKHASKAGVEQAFKGIAASGGTDHSAGIRAAATAARKPAPDEDVVMLWIGDGGEAQVNGFVDSVRRSGLAPVAFGWLHLPGDNLNAISNAAGALGIPCFKIDEGIFADPYAIPRTIRALIAATPVGKAVTTQAVLRVSLVDEILKTELLRRPAWASPVLPAPKAAATAVREAREETAATAV